MYESCKVLIIKYIFIKSDSSTKKSIKHYRGGVMKGLSKKWMAPFVIVYPTSALHDICRTAGTLKSFSRSG